MINPNDLKKIYEYIHNYLTYLSLKTGLSIMAILILGIICIVFVEKITKNLISVLCTGALFIFAIIVLAPVLK